MSTSKGTLLVVDDEKNIRLTVSHTLIAMGYEVDTAVNGEEAINMLDKRHYDLALLDLKMPGMDGLQLLRHIAREQPHLPTAMITAHGTVDNAVEAMKLGATDFLQKPFTPQEIRELVTTIFERRHLATSAAGMSYDELLSLARHLASTRQLDQAVEYTRQAIGQDPNRPEAFNVLGILHELLSEKLAAQKNFRVAINLDQMYRPARENLGRSTDHTRRNEPFTWG
jgi:DNA-binding NtrC family response regulator